MKKRAIFIQKSEYTDGQDKRTYTEESKNEVPHWQWHMGRSINRTVSKAIFTLVGALRLVI